MKKVFKRIKRGVLSLALVLSMAIANLIPVTAAENAGSLAMAEYLEKKAVGAELSEIYDEDGNVIAYYEPFSDTNPERPAPRYRSDITWTISANHSAYGENVYTLSEGDIITVKISQSKTGSSYIGLYDRNNSKYVINTSSYSTNGWDGTITLLNSGLYSIAIQNASSTSITYTGYYSL